MLCSNYQRITNIITYHPIKNQGQFFVWSTILHYKIPDCLKTFQIKTSFKFKIISECPFFWNILQRNTCYHGGLFLRHVVWQCQKRPFTGLTFTPRPLVKMYSQHDLAVYHYQTYARKDKGEIDK